MLHTMTLSSRSDAVQTEVRLLDALAWDDSFGEVEDRFPLSEEECWSYDPNGDADRYFQRHDLDTRDGEDIHDVLGRVMLWSDQSTELSQQPTGHRLAHVEKMWARLEVKVEAQRELHLAQRDLPIPRTLLEAEAILELRAGHAVQTPERLTFLVYKLDRDLRHRMRCEGVDPDDQKACHPLSSALWDVSKVILRLRQIWKNFFQVAVGGIQARREKLRAALALVLEYLDERAERFEDLRAFLVAERTEQGLPPPQQVRPRPPSAPLAPPV